MLCDKRGGSHAIDAVDVPSEEGRQKRVTMDHGNEGNVWPV